MVDRDVLSSRLSALESYLAELRPFGSMDRNRYVAEPALHHLAERLLHLACECALDIAQHVISDQGYRQPATYKDAMEVLRQEGLLTDHGRTFDAIEHDLGDLDRFAASMARLLGG